MGNQDVNPQPGAQFDPGKSYLVRGDLLNRLLAAALPVRAGKGLREFQTPKGKILALDGELGGGAVNCPLGSTLDDAGTLKLRGGSVTGGVSNETVSPITLATSVADGTHLWLRVDFTANNADDVLLPGVEEISSVTTGSGTTIPDNIIPTMADPTGRIYIDLGSYQGNVFTPSGCGNVTLSHCPGSITYYRTE